MQRNEFKEGILTYFGPIKIVEVKTKSHVDIGKYSVEYLDGMQDLRRSHSQD